MHPTAIDVNIRVTRKKTLLLREGFPEAIKAFMEQGFEAQELSNDDVIRRAVEDDYKLPIKYIFKIFKKDAKMKRGYRDGGYIIYHKDGTINFNLERIDENGKVYEIKSKYSAIIEHSTDYERDKLRGAFIWLTTDYYLGA